MGNEVFVKFAGGDDIALRPADAMPRVMSACDVVLNRRGGEGCVRELLDRYFLRN